MRLGLFEEQPLWIRTFLACLGFFGGIALSVFGVLFWLGALVAVFTDSENLTFQFAVGTFCLTLGIASVWGGARDLRECYSIVRQRISQFKKSRQG